MAAGTQSGEGGARTLATRLHVSRRSLQVVLGLIWIFDGLLKFQPDLLRPSFISNVIRPMAIGQPDVLSTAINHMASFLSHGATAWVAAFGLIEIGIGAGMLFQKTVKRALALSFVWGIGIYLFGEGLGMVFTGHTSPLQGAPGAVCFYVLLGVLVWPPAEADRHAELAGARSSAAGGGALGGTGALLVWAGIWIFEAMLWLLPFNRSGNAISTQMSDAATGEPGWYASLLHLFGRAFTGAGVWTAALLAVVSIVIALGPLMSHRPQVFLGLGIAVAILYWITGQGLGELLTFGGTDPSNGPIVALIGLSMLPTIPLRASDPTPSKRFVSRHPLGAVVSALAVVLVPLSVAVVPASADVASAQAASTSMKGMKMSPSGMGSMNMSGMAGLGVTNPKWKYTGPPLPPAEVARLTAVSARTDAGHKMQTPNCTKAPTAQDMLGATQYVQETSEAVAKYKDLSVAKAAGYVAITNPNYSVVHYLNAAYMNRQDIFNPNKVDSLVYATTPRGPVLVAAMYLMPGPGDGPMPYGCLVQWHAHTNLCTNVTTGKIDGFTPCGPGTVHEGSTPMMTHVWQVPVAGGPLAMDPSDLQVVEAAIMAQEKGLAPTSAG